MAAPVRTMPGDALLAGLPHPWLACLLACVEPCLRSEMQHMQCTSRRPRCWAPNERVSFAVAPLRALVVAAALVTVLPHPPVVMCRQPPGVVGHNMVWLY